MLYIINTKSWLLYKHIYHSIFFLFSFSFFTFSVLFRASRNNTRILSVFILIKKRCIPNISCPKLNNRLILTFNAGIARQSRAAYAMHGYSPIFAFHQLRIYYVWSLFALSLCFTHRVSRHRSTLCSSFVLTLTEYGSRKRYSRLL
jgi:hypothetical protein